MPPHSGGTFLGEGGSSGVWRYIILDNKQPGNITTTHGKTTNKEKHQEITNME